MRYATILGTCLLLISAGMSQSSNEEDNKSLKDVIVKETFEAGTEEEKLPVYLQADFSNLVEIPDRIFWSSVEWKYNDGQPTSTLFDCRISSPELCQIIPAPAKIFHLNFKDLASWKIDIFRSDGQNFRTISGEDDPPTSISWNGRGADGTPLVPGEHYSYSFTATDKAGNRRTFPGEAFTVSALYLTSQEGIWIGLSNALLFSPEGYGLMRSADEIATELTNFVYYFSKEGKITVQSNHTDTDKFLHLISGKLGRDIGFFKKETASAENQNCFIMLIN
jgi:hypothetical protein